MTGYGSAQAAGEPGNVTIEIRSVNSRYLDLQFRMPDELRLAEIPLRQLLSQSIVRGKVEVRGSYVRAQKDIDATLSEATLAQIQSIYQHAKVQLPELAAPTFQDILQWSDTNKTSTDPQHWVDLCLTAGKEAIDQLTETRAREGQRLVTVISDQANQIVNIVQSVRSELPGIMQAQSEKLAKRLRDAFEQACPQGLPHITGEEISQRLAAEVSLFSLRADVAEELDRLTLHLGELQSILAKPTASKSANARGIGKRLDFLFQEMNREANTLGSKAVHVDLTRAAIDLKLLIEQMREQIQNIE